MEEKGGDEKAFRACMNEPSLVASAIRAERYSSPHDPSMLSAPDRARFEAMKASPFNQKTIAEFHDKKGRGVGMWGDNLLLLTAQGAKSGELITTPLVGRREGSGYVVVASKGGAPMHPSWFGNVTVNPDVEVEVVTDSGTEKFTARALVVESRAERDRLYKQMVKIWPSFADYEKRTERLIPVVILERQAS